MASGPARMENPALHRGPQANTQQRGLWHSFLYLGLYCAVGCAGVWDTGGCHLEGSDNFEMVTVNGKRGHAEDWDPVYLVGLDVCSAGSTARAYA